MLVKILSDYLNNRITEYPALEEETIELARRHGLAGVLYHQTGDLRLQGDYVKAISRYANKERLLEMLRAETAKTGTRFFLVKGLELARLYPVPELRTMGDLDIVTAPDDMEAMHAALMACGLRCNNRSRPTHWSYFDETGSEYELHCELLGAHEEGVNLKDHGGYFNDFARFLPEGRASDEFHFLFLLVHLRKHMINYGVGLRQFMDVAVLSRQPMDWELVRSDAKKLGLTALMERTLAFNARAFDVEPPFAVPGMSDEDFIESRDIILKNGTFGFQNPDNFNQLVVEKAIREGGSLNRGRFRFFLQCAFPPYKEMQRHPACGYLITPLLLPLAWIHRGILGLFKKDSRETVFGNLAVSGESADRRLENLRKWGI